MAAENRPTFEQLAALAPGDPVVIETSGDFRRPRHSTGTVVRIEGRQIVASSKSAPGVPTCTASADATECVLAVVIGRNW